MENEQASDLPAQPLDLAEEVDRLAVRAAAGHYDELRADAAEDADTSAPISADWATFFSQIDNDGLQDFDRRTQELARQVKDNGITYNIYADQDGPQRPWSVDLFPLILGNDEWQQIESGVLQRAQLLEKIMADIYGPQKLLCDAFIPPALVQGHPGYLRAMHGVTPTGGKHLHIVALDLARGPACQIERNDMQMLAAGGSHAVHCAQVAGVTLYQRRRNECVA